MTALEGRDLDRAIAEARGWRRYRHDGETWVPTDGDGMWHDGRMWTEPRFATDPAWTLRLLEEMPDPIVERDGDGWVCAPFGYWHLETTPCTAPTLPEAVARAWLAWHEAKEPEAQR